MPWRLMNQQACFIGKACHGTARKSQYFEGYDVARYSTTVSAGDYIVILCEQERMD